MTDEFPQLTFTAQRGNGTIANEARRALNEIRTLRRATTPISTPPPAPRREWDDTYHDLLVELVHLVHHTASAVTASAVT